MFGLFLQQPVAVGMCWNGSIVYFCMCVTGTTTPRSVVFVVQKMTVVPWYCMYKYLRLTDFEPLQTDTKRPRNNFQTHSHIHTVWTSKASTTFVSCQSYKAFIRCLHVCMLKSFTLFYIIRRNIFLVVSCRTMKLLALTGRFSFLERR